MRASKPRVKLGPAPSRHRRATFTVKEVARIRAKTMLDERVIRRYAEGEPVRDSTTTSIERACADLGIEVIA